MSVRPTAAPLPPSLRDHATGTAAWARLVMLWTPLSFLIGLAVVGGEVADGLTALAAFGAAVASFVLAGSVEVKRAADRGASPLAAGTLLATHVLVILGFAGAFLTLALIG